ncbi:hypothetical protein SLA2020_367050 [Shorea laevis]
MEGTDKKMHEEIKARGDPGVKESEIQTETKPIKGRKRRGKKGGKEKKAIRGWVGVWCNEPSWGRKSGRGLWVNHSDGCSQRQRHRRQRARHKPRRSGPSPKPNKPNDARPEKPREKLTHYPLCKRQASSP